MSLPYTDKKDIHVYEDEFKQASSVNRVFNRLLANDKYLNAKVETIELTANDIPFAPVSAIKSLRNRTSVQTHTASSIQGSGSVIPLLRGTPSNKHTGIFSLSANTADIKIDGTGSDTLFVTASTHSEFLGSLKDGMVLCDLTGVPIGSTNTISVMDQYGGFVPGRAGTNDPVKISFPIEGQPTPGMIRGSVFNRFPTPEEVVKEIKAGPFRDFTPNNGTHVLALFTCFPQDHYFRDGVGGTGRRSTYYEEYQPTTNVDPNQPLEVFSDDFLLGGGDYFEFEIVNQLLDDATNETVPYFGFFEGNFGAMNRALPPHLICRYLYKIVNGDYQFVREALNQGHNTLATESLG